MNREIYCAGMRQIGAGTDEIRIRAAQIRALFEQQKRPVRIRRVRYILLAGAAAAMVAVFGTVSAGALNGWDYSDLFNTHYAEINRTPTENSYDFSGMGLDLGDSLRGKDYTVTVQSVIADTKTLYLLYDVIPDQNLRKSGAVIRDCRLQVESPYAQVISYPSALYKLPSGVYRGVVTMETSDSSDLCSETLRVSVGGIEIIGGAEETVTAGADSGITRALEIPLEGLAVQNDFCVPCSLIFPQDPKQHEFTNLMVTPMSLTISRTEPCVGFASDPTDSEGVPADPAEWDAAAIYDDGTEIPLEGFTRCISSRASDVSDTATSGGISVRITLTFLSPLRTDGLKAIRFGAQTVPLQ